MQEHSTKKKKITTSISLSMDTKRMLEEQAEHANLNSSSYIERLVLEKHYQNKFANQN